MRSIEIPYIKDRGKRYRFFEMLPGLLTWFLLALPFILSLISPLACVIFVLAYLLLWFAKSMGVTVRSLQGFNMMEKHRRLPWRQMLEDLETGEVTQSGARIPAWHADNVQRVQEGQPMVKPQDVVHAIIIATYNESRAVLEPTIQSVLDSDFDMSRVILVLGYEGRTGPGVEAQAKQLVADYKGKFRDAFAVKHTVLEGEVRGKGGNITKAGRVLQEYLEERKIDPINVVVTTLDADNRPDKQYLGALSYVYALTPDPRYVSYQPVPIYTNNIWDVPAPMRVIATGNSFWNLVLCLRPHILRNFSSHAQSMAALIDTDFWSVRTIVEDGHQFWRTYFRYEGRHEVYPLYVPIYQDAVLSTTLRRTLKAQFIQIRRWAWGASDVAYVAEMGFFRKNKVPKADLVMKFLRLLEGHVSWAVAPLILAFSARIPSLFNSQDYASNILPILASRIQTVALVGIFATLYLSFKSLPPKPERYKRRRTVWMLLQWFMLPVTTVLYNALAAINSQTRLIFGWYLGDFDVTEKATISDTNEKVA
jgi:cellulose synthase/poly-beta-1,6-N-acetylglucosamine synthase-like glycosyltransferase